MFTSEFKAVTKAYQSQDRGPKMKRRKGNITAFSPRNSTNIKPCLQGSVLNVNEPFLCPFERSPEIQRFKRNASRNSLPVHLSYSATVLRSPVFFYHVGALLANRIDGRLQMC